MLDVEQPFMWYEKYIKDFGFKFLQFLDMVLEPRIFHRNSIQKTLC